MASSRQIEHLERKHKENPEGLTFAPLANAYRNSGEPERAIEILMQGLEHHPKHAPARIVLGRCHLDLGDDAAAETAFALVLDLDKENVVALKALADITERASRFEDAAQWLGYLLEVDRNNEEAREQLERVNATKAAAEMAGGDVPVEASLEADEAPEADEEADLTEATDDEAAPFMLDSPWGKAAATTGDTDDEEVLEIGEPSIEPPSSTWEPPAIASEVTEGLSATDLEGPGGPAEDASSSEATDPFPAEPVVEEDAVETGFAPSFETEDDISLTPRTHNEFQVPSAAEGLSLQVESENEFQAEQDSEALELRGSENNEFQRQSDAELLRPPEEEDVGEQPISLEGAEETPFSETETAEPGSWFPPTAEEAAASVGSESGPDGTPDPLEAALGSEPGEPVEPPFEESEPLPSPWGPAGDVEEEIGASEDGSVVELEMTSDERDGADVEPGSLLASETTEDAGLPEEETPVAGPEDDLYPEILGSDQEATPLVEVEPAVGAEPEPEPAFVATETMAEVYLSQGHRLEALEVYRALLESTPGDTRLSEKVAALEKELEGGAVAGGEPARETGDGSVVGSGPSYDASATGGQTVKALFRGLLATTATAAPPLEVKPATAEDLANTGQEVVGEPTRPAQDPLSLSAVFGEDTSPVPPALGGGAAKTEAEDGFSFDNFFGDSPGGSDSKLPSRSPSKGREDEEDLDQFQSWLQGLKG